MSNAKKYTPTIGIECHVQLNSKTKLFAATGNDARKAEPNTLISHICVGMPGALPVLNRGALKLAARAAYALGTTPQKFSKFDRKHYFYPDLPKGYQITQYDQPIIIGGQVEIDIDGQKRTIGITRAHLEEDAGKSTHPDGADYSLVDFNRAGTPLLEIVSEPDIHSAEEGKAYARELYLLMKHADVSDCDLYYGNIRFDVNISVSSDPKVRGKRSEIKNLNSFKSVESSISFEIKRQIDLIESGQEVVQETRGWDDDLQKTTTQRVKEEAHDYRYFPDPDIPPVELTDLFINEIEKEFNSRNLKAVRSKLIGAGIESKTVEAILEEPHYSTILVNLIDNTKSDTASIRAANWIKTDLFRMQQETGQQAKISHTELIDLSELVDADKLSSTGAKSVLKEIVSAGGTKSVEQIAKDLNLLQVSDIAEIENIVKKVLEQNPAAASDVKSGEMKAIGFLVGQVMKSSQGRANPKLAQDLIKKSLGL